MERGGYLVKNDSSIPFDLEVENLGEETEAEKQMKTILQKQLNTKLTVREQFSQHRTFVSPSTYKSLTELVQGTCSVDRFKEIEKNEEVREELQRCGLTEDEITDYISYKSVKKTESRLVNPSILEEKVQKIEEKIKRHNDELQIPQTFQDAKKLTRHEMDIERSLYAGCAKKVKLDTLVALDTKKQSSSMDEAYNYIKDFANKLHNKCSKKRKKLKRRDAGDCDKSPSDLTETNDLQYDSNIHHVVVPLEDEEVLSRRLSVEEIRKIPKFESYEMGEPNKILYLKNLHSKTTAQELRSLFSRFQSECGPPIDYRICTGRMKGQAFVTFPDCDTATEALQYANGFLLREKPVIIEFGRKS